MKPHFTPGPVYCKQSYHQSWLSYCSADYMSCTWFVNKGINNISNAPCKFTTKTSGSENLPAGKSLMISNVFFKENDLVESQYSLKIYRKFKEGNGIFLDMDRTSFKIIHIAVLWSNLLLSVVCSLNVHDFLPDRINHISIEMAIFQHGSHECPLFMDSFLGRAKCR